MGIDEGIYTITIIRAVVSHLNFIDQYNNTLISTFVSGTRNGAVMDVRYYVTSIQINATFVLGTVSAQINGNNQVSLTSNEFVQDTNNFVLDDSTCELTLNS